MRRFLGVFRDALDWTMNTTNGRSPIGHDIVPAFAQTPDTVRSLRTALGNYSVLISQNRKKQIAIKQLLTFLLVMER
jgi:hypothetical protein